LTGEAAKVTTAADWSIGLCGHDLCAPLARGVNPVNQTINRRTGRKGNKPNRGAKRNLLAENSRFPQ
jgi:hypothetical protein